MVDTRRPEEQSREEATLEVATLEVATREVATREVATRKVATREAHPEASPTWPPQEVGVLRPRANTHTHSETTGADDMPVVRPRRAASWRPQSPPEQTALSSVPVVRPETKTSVPEELSPARSRFYAQNEMPMLSMPGRAKREKDEQSPLGPAGSMPTQGSAQGPGMGQRRVVAANRPLSAGARTTRSPQSADTNAQSNTHPEVSANPSHDATPPANTRPSTHHQQKMLVESTVSELIQWVKRERRRTKEDDHDRTF